VSLAGRIECTDVGKGVIFVTNNASKSREAYKSKFDKLGVQAEVEEIFGSAYASAVYISSVLKLPKTSKVYVVGMSGIEHELASEGIAYIGGTSPSDNTLDFAFDVSTFQKDPDVAAVLCGLDTAINYTKLCKAFQYLHDDPHEERVKFLATNVDTTYPAKGGLLPGSGALSGVLARALGREPLSLGKPGKVMMDCIKAK
jgi:4-nitrophenyl phosphatase